MNANEVALRGTTPNALSNNSGRPLGIIAGWGSFPVEVAERARLAGREVYVAALKGHASEELLEWATELRWVGVLKLGQQMKFFSRRGIEQVVLAGKIFKDRILYHGMGWIAHLPDWTAYRVLGESFVTKQRDGRDDTVLSAVVRAYQSKGVEVMAIQDIAPDLLVPEGLLSKGRLNRSQQLDAKFAWSIARQMGALDVGQSITVQDQVVLGVEAIEGTDALIKRTGQMCPRGGFTLVKIAKPEQDMRFDVPTIGTRTVEQMLQAGGKSIVIEAGKTILVDREETIQLANRHGIRIIAMRDSQMTDEDPQDLVSPNLKAA
ncbi:MAG: LpxI family protein [Pirellulaceae bacterium]